MSRRTLCLIVPFLVALGCGLASARWLRAVAPVGGDAWAYQTAARAIQEGREYPRDDYPQASLLPFFRPPGYPAFIALIWSFDPGRHESSVLYAQAVLHAALVLLVTTLGLLLHGREAAAAAGGLLCAVHPLLLGHVVGIQTEPLHALLIALASTVTLLSSLDSGGFPTRSTLAGALYGLAALCRPSALPAALAALPVLVWLRRGRDSRTAALGFSAGLILTLFPFTLANRLATGDWIPLTDAGGYHLWLHAMLHSMIRFRLPYVEPNLCLLAGAALATRRSGQA